MTGKVARIFLDIAGKKVPAKIYWERRNNVRASIGKKAAILRMPSSITSADQQKQMSWFTGWVQDQFAENPDLHIHFFGKGYRDGDTIKVGERSYILKFNYSDRKTHSGKLKNNVIMLELSKGDTESHLQKSIKHLLSRLIAQDFLPHIVRKVNELNRIHFQKPIKSVNLKYNQTNWGSCSSKGNVNLSTRLLFAPEEVIDYVIIHELAHLIELNHSARFWKLVSDAMPNYEEQERWLKEYGKHCNF